MSRALLIIANEAVRQKAVHNVLMAPEGTRLEFKEPKRTLPQNDRMWSMLTDISKQKEHNGRKYTPEKWKSLFMHALGQEIEFIPSLDGKSFLPLGYSSSDLSKKEMGELMDLMEAWGAENGVVFHYPSERAA